jgi:hypothetical protein
VVESVTNNALFASSSSTSETIFAYNSGSPCVTNQVVRCPGVVGYSISGDGVAGWSAGKGKAGVLGWNGQGDCSTGPGNTLGDNCLGVYGLASGGNSVGVWGEGSSTGVRGEASGANGVGVKGVGAGVGVHASSAGFAGIEARGLSANSIGVKAVGTPGLLAQHFGPVGNGVHATGSGVGIPGVGVFGINVGTTCPATAPGPENYFTGIFGTGCGSSSIGVRGEGQKFGVYGRVSSPIQSEGAGILGDVGLGQWAGRFLGPVRVQGFMNVEGTINAASLTATGTVTANQLTGVQLTTSGSAVVNSLLVNTNASIFGTLTKGAGAFKIDHPLDPANKFLYHSFVESPDMKNLYDGIVTTGADGFATVEMPSYFEALNMDFRYQLTVIGNGSWARARVYRELDGKTFVIQTDELNVKVSWQVTGTRKDAYAVANRVVVEVDKTGDERGTCIYAPACR